MVFVALGIKVKLLVGKGIAKVVELSGRMTLVEGTVLPETVEFATDNVPEIAPADPVEAAEGPTVDEVMMLDNWEVVWDVPLKGIGPHPGIEGSVEGIEDVGLGDTGPGGVNS